MLGDQFSGSIFPDYLICFFEGDDSKYYGPRLRNKIDDLWASVTCNGKRIVIELYQLISKHTDYRDARVAFFVDRDFDNPLDAKYRNRVYETPCYSVENLYTTQNTFKRILKHEFAILDYGDSEELFKKVLSAYELTVISFHEKILPLNVWIKAHRERASAAKLARLNLQNVKFNKLIQVTIGDVKALYEVAKLKVLFPDAHDFSSKELGEVEKFFGGKDLSQEFRGKYQIGFLRAFIGKLKGALQDPSFMPSKCHCKPKLSLNLSTVNILSELSQYAETPECLEKFITDVCVN